jgi:hypothetical protein
MALPARINNLAFVNHTSTRREWNQKGRVNMTFAFNQSKKEVTFIVSFHVIFFCTSRLCAKAAKNGYRCGFSITVKTYITCPTHRLPFFLHSVIILWYSAQEAREFRSYRAIVSLNLSPEDMRRVNFHTMKEPRALSAPRGFASYLEQGEEMSLSTAKSMIGSISRVNWKLDRVEIGRSKYFRSRCNINMHRTYVICECQSAYYQRRKWQPITWCLLLNSNTRKTRFYTMEFLKE